MRKKTSAGFTLIELLVVISIIGFLAAAVMSNMNEARASARDTVRKQDLRAIQTALELHFTEYGSYTQPETSGIDTSCGDLNGLTACPSDFWDTNSNLRILVDDGFLRELPVDPINDVVYNYYYEVFNAGQFGYPNSGQAYALCSALETGGFFCLDNR